jgi:signal transduction histidine kinase
VKGFGGVPRVRGDAGQLEQAFQFLLENPAQAIPAGSPTEQGPEAAGREGPGW